MISNHLNIINERQPVANELAARVAQFLAMGGEIHAPESNAPLRSLSASLRTSNGPR
ncbi:hypothetical protein SAMN04490185_3182 [Pseudomonas frederiksbergensis]|uniref:Uncharacterized protein n=1 Tax=Pseudomonas frederiksbergensis TaxID=104087 RepID=A0A1H4ZH13_9PSED|nr:hypothetical protein [Pseudomonas frederiksbergensis]SED28721.1 hypothetical protein SAMN04490185_3182 [Pseudomonas frederiksbergensis]